MQVKKEEIKKILCIKPRGIGDIVLSTIVLENLQEYFPSAEIHYLAEEFAKRAVEHNPFVKKVHTFVKKEFVLKIAKRIRKEKFDLIFDFWSNPKTAQITYLSGAKYRVGSYRKGRRYAYNIKSMKSSRNHHAAENHLFLLECLDIPINSKKILFYLSDEEKKYAKSFVENNFQSESIIGILPSGGWESKRCGPEKWIEICNKINDKLKVKFLVLWGPGDEDDAEKIYSSLNGVAIKIPGTTVGELSALINKCDLVIANDSGPMHISAALGVPTIGIFGPTNPSAHRPYSENSDYIIKEDLHCIICDKTICPYNHECMKELDSSEVVLKTEKLLNHRKQTSY